MTTKSATDLYRATTAAIVELNPESSPISRREFATAARTTAKRLLITSTIVASGATAPAAAQVGETSSNLCGTGIDVLIGLIAAIIVIGGFLYGTFEGALGTIKYDNPDPSKSKEGTAQIRSGVVSMVGPALFFLIVGVAAEISGFGIASCFIPDLDVFGATIMNPLNAATITSFATAV